MQKILKYTLKVTDAQTVEMPRNADILCVQAQRAQLTIWAVCGWDTPVVNRKFHVYGTGSPLPEPTIGKYVGTVQIGGFVWHVFDMGEVT